MTQFSSPEKGNLQDLECQAKEGNYYDIYYIPYRRHMSESKTVMCLLIENHTDMMVYQSG